MPNMSRIRSQPSGSGGIEYRTGDATCPQGPGPKVIVHICNDAGKWGAGFVLAISRRWPQPEAAYREAFQQGGGLALGAVQFVPVEAELTVANMVAQHGVRRAGSAPPIRYEVLRKTLSGVARFARANGASVHMPRIGSGLAGGTWEEVSAIVEDVLSGEGIPVRVYDLPGAAQ
jgi:O-acetyl-ADP-ribose deacetylase (regulator of RNase III)